MFDLDMTAIRRTAAIHSPNVANPANRLIASEGLANRWLMAANAVANSAQISQQQPELATLAKLAISQHRLTESQISQQPDPISQQQPELATLAGLAISHDLLTTRLIAAAMRRCDQFNDSPEARQDMREQVLEVPPHQRQDWLDYFNQQNTQRAKP